MRKLLILALALSTVGCASKSELLRTQTDLSSTRKEIGTFSLNQSQNWLEVQRFYNDMEERVKNLESNDGVVDSRLDAIEDHFSVNQKPAGETMPVFMNPKDILAMAKDSEEKTPNV